MDAGTVTNLLQLGVNMSDQRPLCRETVCTKLTTLRGPCVACGQLQPPPCDVQIVSSSAWLELQVGGGCILQGTLVYLGLGSGGNESCACTPGPVLCRPRLCRER